jgi:dTDP-4-amino-4,6-dideoxygalactose transaminase
VLKELFHGFGVSKNVPAPSSSMPRTAPELDNFNAFLTAFREQRGLIYTKINHGFWEALADVYEVLGRPVPRRKWAEADRIAKRKSLFSSGFAPELLRLLNDVAREDDPVFHIGLELSAWPGDDRVIGTPFKPERSLPVLAEYLQMFPRRTDGLLLKKAVMDGRIGEFFDLLAGNPVLIVGPDYIAPLKEIRALKHANFIAIHPNEARDHRDETERAISAWLDDRREARPTVLIQAGTLAPYWILRLRKRYPGASWVDGGLAFSIAAPEDLLKRPWGKVYRREIVRTFNNLSDRPDLPEQDRLEFVETAMADIVDSYADSHATEGPSTVSFVERKPVDSARIFRFLEGAETYNRWANRGPAWYALSKAYETHFSNLEGKRVIPCANGGMALEALIALHEVRAGRRLRWCVSAFGFANTGRGRLSDALKIDCDARGVLSIQKLRRLDPESFDGVIVTNPFGLLKDFSTFTKWQEETGKPLLIDNAAGVSPAVPNLPYQSLSLHHTKPYGFGEGGLAVVPEDEAEAVLRLLEYTQLEAAEAPYWVNNGKLSELAASGQLMRLETQPEWAPLYQMQAIRIEAIAASIGLEPLLSSDVPAMSRPFLAPVPVTVSALSNDRFIIGKYYKPLSPTPEAGRIYEHIVNIPSHPDMQRVSRAEIEAVLRHVLEVAAGS